MSTFDEITGKKTAQNTGAATISEPLPAGNVQAEGVGTTAVKSQEAEPGSEPQQPMTYEEIYNKISPYKPPTQEEVEAEKKKQKREAIFAAIGDGISALSNLYFTTKGAPSMYKADKGASAAFIARRDKLEAEEKANAEAYARGLAEARAKDEKKAKDEREWERTLERDKQEENMAKEAAQLKHDQFEYEKQHDAEVLAEKKAAAAASHNLGIIKENNKAAAAAAKAKNGGSSASRGKQVSVGVEDNEEESGGSKSEGNKGGGKKTGLGL